MEASIQEPIHTERLILRRLETSDSAAVFAFMSRPSVMQYTYAPPSNIKLNPPPNLPQNPVLADP